MKTRNRRARTSPAIAAGVSNAEPPRIMTLAAEERVHRLWDALADFDAGKSDEAAVFLMTELCQLADAWNATWAGATRMDADAEGDPLGGWRVAAMTVLHPLPQRSDDTHFREILRIWDRREIDSSFLLPMRGVGTFRTYSFRRELPPEWFESPFYEEHYRSVGIADAVFVAFPLNQDAESHFGFYSRGVFGDEAIAGVTYALRGIKWFHRRYMQSRGLLMASSPLTPTEQKVLQLLLTGAPEKQVAQQVGIAPSTAHQHITSIFRKFSVRSRAALMSLWLKRG